MATSSTPNGPPRLFLERLFAAGTTSVLAFCSVHKLCADILFAAAEAHGMALITGKTMMDRNAIPSLHDDPETSARESEELLRKWHGRGRARYAISPRFAITSSPAQLKLAGELLKSHPYALMQTHLAESRVEIETVRTLYPDALDYTQIYENARAAWAERACLPMAFISRTVECLRLHASGLEGHPLPHFQYLPGLWALLACPSARSTRPGAGRPCHRHWRRHQLLDALHHGRGL